MARVCLNLKGEIGNKFKLLQELKQWKKSKEINNVAYCLNASVWHKRQQHSDAKSPIHSMDDLVQIRKTF